MAIDPKSTTTAPPMSVRGVKIYTYPKVIFIWPTLVAALIGGFGMLLSGDNPSTPPAAAVVRSEPKAVTKVEAKGESKAVEAKAVPQPGVNEPRVTEAPVTTVVSGNRRFTRWQNMLGVIFLGVFALNCLILAIDFPRFTIVAGALLVFALTFLLLWLGAYFDLLTPLTRTAEGIYTVANAGFYFGIAVILGLMFAVIWITRYLDFWEITPNEVLHHHGPLSDLERYPTINLKFNKEIPDVLEYLLGLGSGRLVLHFGDERRAIVLDNVLFIDTKEAALKNLMGRMNVRIMSDQETIDP